MATPAGRQAGDGARGAGGHATAAAASGKCHASLRRHFQYALRPLAAVQVFSSLTATRKFLEEGGLRPFLLLHPQALPDFAGIPTDNPNCGEASAAACG